MDVEPVAQDAGRAAVGIGTGDDRESGVADQHGTVADDGDIGAGECADAGRGQSGGRQDEQGSVAAPDQAVGPTPDRDRGQEPFDRGGAAGQSLGAPVVDRAADRFRAPGRGVTVEAVGGVDDRDPSTRRRGRAAALVQVIQHGERVSGQRGAVGAVAPEVESLPFALIVDRQPVGDGHRSPSAGLLVQGWLRS